MSMPTHIWALPARDKHLPTWFDTPHKDAEEYERKELHTGIHPLSPEQAVALSACSGLTLAPPEDIVAYAERKLGRLVFAIELKRPEVQAQLQALSKDELGVMATPLSPTVPD